MSYSSRFALRTLLDRADNFDSLLKMLNYRINTGIEVYLCSFVTFGFDGTERLGRAATSGTSGVFGDSTLCDSTDFREDFLTAVETSGSHDLLFALGGLLSFCVT